MRISRSSMLTHAIQAGLGLTVAMQALPALSQAQLADSPHTQYEMTAPATSMELFQQTYGHLSSSALAEIILTQSGALAIDPEFNILYTRHDGVSLLGLSFDELGALAWGVAASELTDQQRFATYKAMEALKLDSTYPYGTLPQVRATVLKRAAQTMGEQALVKQQGIGSGGYFGNNTHLDEETLAFVTKALFTHIAQVTGNPDNKKSLSYIDLTDRSGGYGGAQVLSGAQDGLPHIFVAGSDTVPQGEPFNPLADVIALDSEDGDLTNKILLAGSVDIEHVGSYELTYSVTDSQGQTATAQRTVTVIQAESSQPRILGANTTLTVTGEAFDPMAGVTAWDYADGDLTDRVEVAGIVDTTNPGTYLLSYSVMDDDNRVSRRKRIVLVEDLRAESIAFEGLHPKTISLYDRFMPMAGVKARDETDGNITSAIKVTNPVDTSLGGVYRVRYEVTNSQGVSKTRYKTVVVENNLPALEQLTPDLYTTVLAGTAFDPMRGIIAKDQEDGDLTDRIKVTGEVNTDVPGVYRPHYRVEDNNGGVAHFIRRVTVTNALVNGNTSPTIILQPFTQVPVDGYFDPMASVSAADNEDGDLTSSIVIEGQVDTAVPGFYRLTYSVVDSAGAVRAVERRVSVHNDVPIISGADSLILPIDTPFHPMAGITANDAEDGDLTSAIRVSGSVDTSTAGLYSLLYSVTDQYGGEGFALRGILVKNQMPVENTAPEILGIAPITITVGAPFDPLAGVTATDAEDGNLTTALQVEGAVNNDEVGVYVLRYSVTDSVGATTGRTRSVRVKAAPNNPPVINGTSKTAIALGQAFDPLAGITATDAEDGDLSANIAVLGNVNTFRAGAMPYRRRDWFF